MLSVIVDEKEKKIKESLKMVGLRDSVFWLSWFVVYSAMVTVIALVVALVSKFVIIKSVSFGLLFLLTEIFGLSLIMFAFMTTSLFSKRKSAAGFGGFITMLMALTYYLQVFLTGAPEYVFWLLSLLSPSAFAMAYDKLFLLDIESPTSTSGSVEIDFWDPAGTIPVAGILIMMSVDVVLYGLLAYYLDNVLPTEYGTRRKPWFPLQLSFWVSGWLVLVSRC